MAHGKLGQDLFLAIDHRDLAGVQMLLKKGADPNSRNGLEFTPLSIAAASYQPAVVDALLAAGAKADAQSPYGTPLTFASATGNIQGATVLLSHGATVDSARGDGNTPLIMAANAGNPALVAELIRRKANVNAKNVTDSTALTYAARMGNLEVGKLLLDAGAVVDSADEDGQTPLMTAAVTGHADFVKLLLDKGAKVNARDNQKRTALILATSYGNYPAVVRTLLDGGADAKAKDAKGRTAGDLAAARGYSDSAAMLGSTSAPKMRDSRLAIRLSIKVLQASMTEFGRNTACISCHQEGLGRMATGAARDRGFTLDKSLQKLQTMRIMGTLNAMKPLHAMALKNPEAMKQLPLIEINEVTTVDSWVLAGMAAQHDAPTEATAAMAMVLAKQQSPDGHWSFSMPRIPMQSSVFTFTALAARSLTTYGPASKNAEIKQRVAKAQQWLLKAPAQTCDDRAFRLLGLKWTGANLNDRQKAAEEIIAAQQPDGGWAQVPGMHSDAYATGQALYALSVGGGLPATDPVYQRGVRYLLRTQDDDGSWFVSKRALAANNYFDGGFPHGESQYSSFNGTSWALMALLQTVNRK